jgi:O-antigen/teichoic acid export membrane protein
MWNAYTEAAVKGDYVWIKSNFRRSLAIWALMLSGGLFMLLVAHLFFQFWVGNAVTVPFSVSLSVLCYITFFNLNNCVTMLINGLNKISVQIVTSVIATAAFLVAVMILGPKLGIEGVVGCMAASYAAMAAVHLYQCHLLIHQKATGIWNR